MPAAIPAAIAGAGSVAGGLSSKSGAKKAAKIQQQTAASNNAFLQGLYNQNQANFQPRITSGNRATSALDQLLGLVPSDQSPTEILRATPGYQFRMNEALNGVNASAYARGVGNSGAALKALQDRAYGIADQSFNDYVGQVGDVANRGLGATSALAGVSTNYGNAVTANNNNAADAASNAALAQAAAIQQIINGVGGAAGSIFGGGANKLASSYAKTPTSGSALAGFGGLYDTTSVPIGPFGSGFFGGF